MPQRYIQPILKAIAGIMIAVMLCIISPGVANAQVLPNKCASPNEIIFPGGSITPLPSEVYDLRASTFNVNCDWFIDVDNGHSQVYVDDRGGSETVTYIDFGFIPKFAVVDNSACPDDIVVDYCVSPTFDY